MDNRILTEMEVMQISGINPYEKGITYRKFGTTRMFILSDVIDFLESTLPYRRFEPIIENGYLIIESKL